MLQHKLPLILTCAVIVAIQGCNSQTLAVKNDTTDNKKRDADKLLVVDCLLPGQIRKLGTSLTYLSPRRPVRTSARDCEIRGGEYASYDRADYRTALNVWLESAKQGDAESQVYVGEIFEKGLGTEPNYSLAADWYRKAAMQGNTRGAINLGYLYEKGLGVEKDMVESLNWYRKASGLEDDDLQFASTIEAASEQKLGQLRQQLSQSRKETEALRSQLESARRQLQQDQSNFSASENDLEALKGELDQHKAAANLAEAQRLEQEIIQREAELRGQRTQIEKLKSEVAAYQEQIINLDAQDTVAVGGPSIELLDPPITLTRGVPTVRLRSVMRERIIVGKVKAPSGLSTLTVNSRPETVDAFGIFQTPVVIKAQRTPVNIVAIDNRGQRSVINFQLIPKSSPTAPAAAIPEPSKPGRIAGPVSIEFGSYHALIIGNNHYDNFPDLESAVNDAETASAVLHDKYGFQTTLLINADRYAILSALSEFRKQLTKKDNLLIYYAGHGELDNANERGHWLPVDAEANSPANWISNTDITDILNTIPAKHVLVVADSCYSGALTRSSLARLAPDLPENLRMKWYKVMASSRSRTALTSGGLEPVLDSGGGQHSIFANAFIGTLQDNDSIMEAYGVFRQVSYQVTRAAAKLNMEQTPQYAPIRHGGHESGEFLFVPKDLRS